MDCYYCSIASGVPTFLEHNGWKWVNHENIDLLDWLPADLEVVRAVKTKLLKMDC